jgi:hypothetical protein
MPFQIAPFVLYLTRQGHTSQSEPAAGVAAKLNDDASPK